MQKSEAMMNSKTTFRESTVKLLRRVLTPLLEYGLISRDEFDLMFTYLGSLAKTGKPPPEVTPKFIRGPEVAELLAICYAEFRKLEAEGVFPFKRRAFGKNVRYFYPDIVEFMRSGGIENELKNEKNV